MISGMTEAHLRRFAVSAATAAVFAALYALYAFGQQTLYRAILFDWGVAPFNFPFLDIHFVLSSLECSRQGIDVYVTNPCDVLGRAFNYSPLLLWMAPIGVGSSATNMSGLIVDGVFLLSLACLPPPRRISEAVILLFGTLSTATAFAAERANLDLVVFALAAVTGILLLRHGGARIWAYAVIVSAALIKFYPAALLILALRERPLPFIAIAAVAASALAAFVGIYHAELALVFANLPRGYYFNDRFGAGDLPNGLATLFPAIPPLPVLAALVIAAGCGMAALAFREPSRNVFRLLDPAESMFLVIGCALMVGCFFAGQSIGYRGVFVIFALPGLFALARMAESSFIRVLFSVSGFLAIFLLWGEFFRLAIGRAIDNTWVNLAFWLGRELAWWWLIAVMGALLLRFALDSEIGRRLGCALSAHGTDDYRQKNIRVDASS
jgi:hypothetical protein